ncbi:FAD-dependent oxidoreductase [Nostocoides sp. Soil756]|jgi:3-phenylpropionate/trans-cinnamate dioxygenase ferredoxin reductase subunit|uniref:NAD(P)/FAD-dependent oxidoreductase n=1 Tax=Nostocoides sp. Soil756 TaxID=1736399 RepID=UPI0006FE6749|nr:FAD-dependent oxidoreductase [Tetrasphaera sp. Soil756]KRE63639.1 hypothetical protein ASG78_01745 [Tetrasphaera sp. Soil756]
MESPRFVVVGGGPAAAGAARRFAEAGATVAVLTAEPRGPYDRTVLSKDVLLAPGADIPSLLPPGAPWLEHVFVRPRTRVEAIDPDAGILTTDDGTTWAFEAAILATGAEPRRLVVPGADGPDVLTLRDAADAAALTAVLGTAGRLVVVGGGVIGLEVAAAAVARGVPVEVVEAADRLLPRGVPAPVAAWLARRHEAAGVVVRTGVTVQEVRREAGRVVGVHLSDGSEMAADAVVAGIGVAPRTALAEAAGLTVDDGVVVDAGMRTSHPAVLAAGDVVRMRAAGGGRGERLESYTAAGRQGAVAAATALGVDDPFDDVPWSWSDQGDASMQSMGVAPAGATEVLVGDAAAPVVLSLDAAGRLLAVCGVTTGPGVARPVRAAAAAIAAGARVDLDAARAAGGDLAALAGVLRTAGRG